MALEEYNRFNNGTGGAFAIPSRFSPDYDLVADLAQEVRRQGRPVTWEEMGFPNLETDIDRPVKKCPGGGNRTPGSIRTPSQDSVRPPSQGSVRSSLGSTARYSDGARSTPSSVRTRSTVPQSASRPASRASSLASNDTRRTLDFREADNFFDYGGYARSSTAGGLNPQTGRFDIPE